VIGRLRAIFALFVIGSISTIAYNLYSDYRFKNSELSERVKERIYSKEREVIERIKREFGIDFDVPLLITDKIPSKIFGLTSYRGGKITIYINRSRLKESLEYILDDVIAHEYAHALMFRFGHFREPHTVRWQNICKKLKGKSCKQYVDIDYVISDKIGL
jgi:uncharacterized protein YjaZ